MTHFLILLRNLQPKKVHGKLGQAVALLTVTKKTHVRASAPNTTFRLNCYAGIVNFFIKYLKFYRPYAKLEPAYIGRRMGKEQDI